MTKPRGFTLIEAIAVIAITGIIASVVAVFIARPIQGYVDSTRRALLSDMADTSLRRMGREIRTAIPNSVQIPGGTGTRIEFIPSSDGARYRVEQATAADDFLDFASATDNSFQVFGVSPVAAGANDYFVIFNTGQCSNAGCTGGGSCIGANAYEGCNRRTITAAGAGISFMASGQPLPFDSPSHRLQIVPANGPVMFACEGVVGITGGNGTGTLRRYTSYATGAGPWAAFAPDGTGALLAEAVSDCAFTYVPGVTQRSGLVTLEITLTRANESVRLHHEIHVDNQP